MNAMRASAQPHPPTTESFSAMRMHALHSDRLHLPRGDGASPSVPHGPMLYTSGHAQPGASDALSTSPHGKGKISSSNPSTSRPPRHNRDDFGAQQSAHAMRHSSASNPPARLTAGFHGRPSAITQLKQPADFKRAPRSNSPSVKSASPLVSKAYAGEIKAGPSDEHLTSPAVGSADGQNRSIRKDSTVKEAVKDSKVVQSAKKLPINETGEDAVKGTAAVKPKHEQKGSEKEDREQVTISIDEKGNKGISSLGTPKRADKSESPALTKVNADVKQKKRVVATDMKSKKQDIRDTVLSRTKAPEKVDGKNGENSKRSPMVLDNASVNGNLLSKITDDMTKPKPESGRNGSGEKVEEPLSTSEPKNTTVKNKKDVGLKSDPVSAVGAEKGIQKCSGKSSKSDSKSKRKSEKRAEAKEAKLGTKLGNLKAAEAESMLADNSEEKNVMNSIKNEKSEIIKAKSKLKSEKAKVPSSLPAQECTDKKHERSKETDDEKREPKKIEKQAQSSEMSEEKPRSIDVDAVEPIACNTQKALASLTANQKYASNANRQGVRNQKSEDKLREVNTTEAVNTEKATKPTLSRLDLRNLLTDGKRRASIVSPQVESVPDAPVAMPVPALSLLRSTPRSRGRNGGGSEGKRNSLASLLQQTNSPTPIVTTPPSARARAAREKEQNSLLKLIHQIEGEINSAEKKLSALRSDTQKLDVADCKDKELKNDRNCESADEIENAKMGSVDAEQACWYDAIAKCSRKRPAHLMHSQLRLLMVQNQAKAAGANSVFRSLCHDTQLGLDAEPIGKQSVAPLSDEALARMTEGIRNYKIMRAERRRKLAREYVEMRHQWREGLKASRESWKKEKREGMRERDRYLVLSTRGANALLTSKTSSGRTTTKVVPSVSGNGLTNGMPELEQLLSEIEAEGGTPGSREIWSRTLAAIPDQDVRNRGCDCSSVLVEDAVADLHRSRMINPWRLHEKVIFLEKFVMYPKKFMKIASFLKHKSTRECAKFYFDNKLDLGIKQLVKEASTLKRKGGLRAQIVTMARKRICAEGGSVMLVCNGDVRMVGAEEGVEKYMSDKESRLLDVVNGSKELSLNKGLVDDRKESDVAIKRSERILNDWDPLDLSGIDHGLFMQAFRKHGTDWRALGVHVGAVGRSSRHFREYYRRNRQRVDGEVFTRLVASRGSNVRESGLSSLGQAHDEHGHHGYGHHGLSSGVASPDKNTPKHTPKGTPGGTPRVTPRVTRLRLVSGKFGGEDLSSLAAGGCHVGLISPGVVSGQLMDGERERDVAAMPEAGDGQTDRGDCENVGGGDGDSDSDSDGEGRGDGVGVGDADGTDDVDNGNLNA